MQQCKQHGYENGLSPRPLTHGCWRNQGAFRSHAEGRRLPNEAPPSGKDRTPIEPSRQAKPLECSEIYCIFCHISTADMPKSLFIL